MSKYIICSFCLTIAIQGCVFQNADTRFAERFIDITSPQDREKRMELYSLEDQYKIYIYGMQEIHPPMLGLAESIAKRGAVAIPFLLSKLTSTQNDLAVHNTVFIIEIMKLLKYYDAGQDPNIIEVISKRISKMEDPFWKRMTLDSLKTIRGH